MVSSPAELAQNETIAWQQRQSLGEVQPDVSGFAWQERRGTENAHARWELPRTDVRGVGTSARDVMVDSIEHAELCIDSRGSVPLPWTDYDVATSHIAVIDAGEVQRHAVARSDRPVVVALRLDCSDSSRDMLWLDRDFVVDCELASDEGARDDGAGSFGRERSVDPQPRTTSIGGGGCLACEIVESAAQISDTRAVDAVDSDDRRAFEERVLEMLLDVHSCKFCEIIVDKTGLGERNHAVAMPEHFEDAEMLFGLRFPALGRRDHKEAGVDGANPREHVLDEPDVTGNVDEADPAARRQSRPREAEIDGQAAGFLLGQPIRIDVRQGAYERRFAVIDMSCGRDDVHASTLGRSGSIRASSIQTR